MLHSGVSRSAYLHWQPPVCIWGVAAIMDFPYAGGAAVYLYQFYYCNTAHPYFGASDAGKIVSQNRARRFNESRGQRMIIRDENYFTDKYELTRTHSEVLEAVKVVKPGKTLDLGCGNGRNSLYGSQWL